MENYLEDWRRKTRFNCETVTRLSSDNLEGKELTFGDKLKSRLHRIVCIWCRRYYKQTNLLNEAMKTHQQNASSDKTSKITIRVGAKERIKKTLVNIPESKEYLERNYVGNG